MEGITGGRRREVGMRMLCRQGLERSGVDVKICREGLRELDSG